MNKEVIIEKIKELVNMSGETDNEDYEALFSAVHWIVEGNHEREFNDDYLYPFCVQVYARNKLDKDMVPIKERTRRRAMIANELKNLIK